MTELRRRDISGIYIFDTFPNEQHHKPTCIEDCQQETRRAWCMSKDKDHLRGAIKMLADTLKDLFNYLHQEQCVSDEMHQEVLERADRMVKDSKLNWALDELADQVDTLCKMITLTADHCGVTKHVEEEDGK